MEEWQIGNWMQRCKNLEVKNNNNNNKCLEFKQPPLPIYIWCLCNWGVSLAF